MEILALVETREHVCCRYRVEAFRPALEAAGARLVVQGLARGTLARLKQLRSASRFDAVLLQRKLLPGWQLKILRAAAQRLIFDFDDAVVFRDSFDARGPHCRRRRRRFVGLMRSVDLALAGNGFLAQLAIDHGLPSSRVLVMPTCVDTAIYTPKTHENRESCTLVWVGSSSTLRGMEEQSDLWSQAGREIPNLRLRLVCDRFARFDPLPIEERPWSSATEVADITSADVGIAWMPHDVWSRGKCGLKLLQYMAAGLPVVANPVGVHAEMIDEGRNGRLAGDDATWLKALAGLARDPSQRAEMGRAARALVEREYSLDAWSSRFARAVMDSGERASPELAGPHLHAQQHQRSALTRSARSRRS